MTLRTVAAATGSMPAYVVEPPGHVARRKPIVLLHEAFGLNPHMESIADRLAALGHPTIAPHLHHRRGDQAAAYDDVPLAESYVASLGVGDIAADIDAAARMIASGNETVDVMGFCFGGAAAYIAAARSANIHRAVAVYPVSIVRYWDEAGTPKVPLLIIFGDRDEFLGADELAWLEDLHKDPGLPVEVRLYPGAGHAFLNDERPEYYRRDQAEKAWSHALAFLGGSDGARPERE